MMLKPGSTIGVLGTGQLGRMLCSAAAKLGFRTAVFGPDADGSPAGEVATMVRQAAYDDLAAVKVFAEEVDAVTYEFENVPAATAATVTEAGGVLAPPAAALAASQERVREKDFFRSLGIKTVDYWPVASADDLGRALPEAGPSILKTCQFGYDGKGQASLQGAEDPVKVLADLGGGPWILEAKAAFSREVSQVAARGRDGAITFFDLAENEHRSGILHRSVLPAQASDSVREQAQTATRSVLEKLDYVGVLTVEFFDCDGELFANEMAPRVHNSGHVTHEACSTGQFEQHIRAVAGWPLGDTRTLIPSEMINLIGHDTDEWRALTATLGASLTLYGKKETAPGRKMGHWVRPLNI
ncbi:MAG: 5-(carboxyamino)imidazole ribonucleotide synthase [Pseudomonadota bacterium]